MLQDASSTAITECCAIDPSSSAAAAALPGPVALFWAVFLLILPRSFERFAVSYLESHPEAEAAALAQAAAAAAAAQQDQLQEQQQVNQQQQQQ